MELIDAMAMGSFLPADRESLGKWTDSTVESALTKNLFLRTLNMSWKTQRIFIMCTGDFVNKKHPNTLKNDKGRKVAYSDHDNSGPQHLKAHVGDEVCYMYRWNDRGFWPGHHVEDPYGWDTFRGEPWNLKVSDIITSSVLASRRPASDLEMLASSSRLAIGPNAEFIADPTTPGMFNLPVCHTHWNWNGPTEGVSIFKTDLNAFSGHKIMPCYCGPLGADTKSIWEQLRLDTSGARRHYLLDSCPRQISAKIDNPLERYVAYCRLGIHRKLGVRKWGEDKFCDVVIAELEKHGVKDVQSDMNDEQILGFLCKIERSKVHPDCWRFRKTPMDKVWEEAQALGNLDKRRRKDAWRAFKDFLRLD